MKGVRRVRHLNLKCDARALLFSTCTASHPGSKIRLSGVHFVDGESLVTPTGVLRSVCVVEKKVWVHYTTTNAYV